MKTVKRYVEVTAHTNTDGKITPVVLWWDRDHSYEIDKVLDIRRAASLKAGGVGIRYTVRIRGRDRYIWLEDDGRWFVEAKEEQSCADDTP